MATPRDGLDYSGIKPVNVTYKYDSTIVFDNTKAKNSAQAGLAVTLTADDTVGLCADGDHVLGRLEIVHAGGQGGGTICSVQVRGYLKLPLGNAATVTRGNSIVGALGAASAKGYIRGVNTAVAAELGKASGTVQRAVDASNNVLIDIG